MSEARARLAARGRFGVRPGLAAISNALAALGDPHLALPAIHVAGTNGKGSVSAMVATIAERAGLRTALFTSPHLQRLAERFVIDGRELDDATLDHALDRALATDAELTFFEVCTAAAFLAFAEAKVDVAVVEVGLGGRLDATNVLVDVRASAVTRIALDHEAVLGPTLAAIAVEKAGILRHGVPAVIGRMEASARAAIVDVATRIGAPLAELGRDLGAAPGRIRIGGEPPIRIPALGLTGDHQWDNAALAVWLAQHLPRRPSPDELVRALAEVRWPGRIERVAPDVIVDGAHNPDGAAALARALGASTLPRPRTLVFGVSADKDALAMLAVLAPEVDAIILTESGSERAAEPQALAAAVPAGLPLTVEPVPETALALARARGAVVVAGSLFLVGRLRARLLGEPLDEALTQDPAATRR